MKQKQIGVLLALCLFLIFGVWHSIEQTALSANSYQTNLQLLARAVNGEARGEPYEGQVAVAAVILNRVRHPSFPNTVAGVIYQPGAFTAVSDGQINVPIDPKSTIYKACTDAMNGWDPSGGAIYYFNPKTATSKWIWSRPVIKQIGNHRFAK
ncbi:MAG: cell wall hydrolase [Clostridia bacterium]|nr:cell wall hydrolase [Clostridia bacterium]